MTDLLTVKFTASNAVRGKRPYTIYEIEVRSSTTMPWLLYKRYRDFDLLHQQLTKFFHSSQEFNNIDVKLYELPPKRFVRSMARDVVAKRQKELQEYLYHLLSNPILVRQQLILDFLSVPESLRSMLLRMRRNTEYARLNRNGSESVHSTGNADSYSTQYTSKEEKHVNILLKELALQKNRVKALSNFEQWYFGQKKDPPVMKPELIRTLFIGDDTYQGLAYSCKLLHSKVAWRGSITLLVRLLDIERNKHARVFQEAFRTLDHGIFRVMDLHRHIRDATQEDGFRIVSLINKLVPELDVKYYVPDEQALKQYERWCKVKKESHVQSQQKDIYFNDIKNETHFAYNFQELTFHEISEKIHAEYKLLSEETDEKYTSVENTTFGKSLKVRYKKEKILVGNGGGVENDENSIVFEKWKLKITFVVNHKPSDVYDFLLNDLQREQSKNSGLHPTLNISMNDSKMDELLVMDEMEDMFTASEWNSKVIEQTVNETLDDKHFIVHSTFKTFNSPYKFRDFVDLYCLSADEEEKRYLILFSSVYNYENLGEFKDRDRTIILPSGFEIRPTQQNVNVSHVSYRSIMTAGSVSLVAADLLGETNDLFYSMMRIDTLLTLKKNAGK